MHYSSFPRLLESDPDRPTARYAIVDCAATEADDSIYAKLISEGVEKHNLFTGETAWTIDHVAPYLLPLDGQPELAQWLIENRFGVYLTSDADIPTLLLLHPTTISMSVQATDIPPGHRRQSIRPQEAHLPDRTRESTFP